MDIRVESGVNNYGVYKIVRVINPDTSKVTDCQTPRALLMTMVYYLLNKNKTKVIFDVDEDEDSDTVVFNSHDFWTTVNGWESVSVFPTQKDFIIWSNYLDKLWRAARHVSQSYIIWVADNTWEMTLLVNEESIEYISEGGDVTSRISKKMQEAISRYHIGEGDY